MKIQLFNLRKGPNRFHFSIPPDNIDLPPDIFTADIQVECVLDEAGDVINTDFHISAALNLICHRCAIEFATDMEIETKMYFIPSTAYREDEDDVKYFHPDKPEVEVGEDIHDALLLAVPQKVLCREDCRGLCQRCGADLNYSTCECAEKMVDSKWSALRELIE